MQLEAPVAQSALRIAANRDGNRNRSVSLPHSNHLYLRRINSIGKFTESFMFELEEEIQQRGDVVQKYGLSSGETTPVVGSTPSDSSPSKSYLEVWHSRSRLGALKQKDLETPQICPNPGSSSSQSSPDIETAQTSQTLESSRSTLSETGDNDNKE